jgi:hypothetical protein
MLVNQTQWAQDATRAYKEYAEGITALQTREQQQRQEALKRLQDTAPQDRMSAVQSEMDMAQKNLDGLTARAEMAREEMEKLKPTWLSLGQAGKKLWEAQASEYNELKERAAEAGRWVNTLDEEMKKADVDAKAAKRAAGDAAAEEIERQAKQQSKAADEEQQRQQEELKDREQFAEDWKMEDMFTVPGYEESLREMKVYEDALAATGKEADATREEVQRMKREITSNTMGVVSMGEAFDIARQGAMRSEPVDRFAGIGEAVMTAPDPATMEVWTQIAAGINALVQKEGLTVEEVSL